MTVFKKLTDKEIDERLFVAMNQPPPMMTNPQDVLGKLLASKTTQQGQKPNVG